MPDRYDIRPDAEGWTAFDQWTGAPVVLGLVPQVGLTHSDAAEIADMLNRRAPKTAILQ